MAARFVALVSLGSFEQVSGHGWITSPAPRQKGLAAGCDHCLNGGAICGSNSYMNVYKGPQAKWKEGSVVEVTVAVTAHHMGHYELSICDEVITSSTPNAQACLDAHILERASAEEAGIFDCQPGDNRAACQPIDERHPERFYLPPSGFSPSGYNRHTFYLKLPTGLKCEACTMQWRWWTANSCIPATDYACFKETLAANGYSNSDRWGLTNWQRQPCPGGSCNRCSCGEEFRNCVDVSIADAGGVVPTPAPTTTTTTTTSTMAPKVTTTTTTQPASGCSVVSSGGKTWGATVAKCEKTCPRLDAGDWPCRAEGPCVCASSPRPSPRPTAAPTASPTPMPTPMRTPMPTPRPTPRPTPSPTPSSTGECKANRSVNRGVSDSHCAQCKTGYQWWPCNEQILCVGDGCKSR